MASFYIRAFCTSDKVPPLRHVLEYLRSRGHPFHLSPDSGYIPPDSPNWDDVILESKEDVGPITLHCSRDDGTEESLFFEEIREFLYLIGRPGLNMTKRRVIKHLKMCKVIFASKLPPDTHAEGRKRGVQYDVIRYLASKASGLVQVDGEGFYQDEKLLLKM